MSSYPDKERVIPKLERDRDRVLQLLLLNEEFLVIVNHQFALITSLPLKCLGTPRRDFKKVQGAKSLI
jgi:hypothetical protein